MTTTSPRTAFEQQLCTHLLSLSELVETLADRLIDLDARLAEVEGQQVADAEIAAVSDDAGELLSASEEKVRMLRERLNPSQVMSLHTVDSPDSAADEAPHPEALREDECVEDERVEDEAISDDTEYVDDPQIDLLSA
ncbi:hypothetical protein [Synechococcus sp. CC9616]|uniref:hypothetical protein n=1 Tax=Synechococcus sp. CC9616 TaxID=110663 RepID=UPI001E2FC0DA|nr:hypothetical protein [Synechococcus sp. CC9616]